MMSNAAKNVYILATSLNVLHNKIIFQYNLSRFSYMNSFSFLFTILQKSLKLCQLSFLRFTPSRWRVLAREIGMRGQRDSDKPKNGATTEEKWRKESASRPARASRPAGGG